MTYRFTLDDVVLGWVWFLFGMFAISAVVIFLQIITRTPLKARVLKHLSLVSVSLAATFYLAVGLTFWQPDKFGHHFFYFRFLLWLTSIPILLAGLSHLGGLSSVNTFAICGFSLLYVVSLFVAYQADGPGKWVAVVASGVFLVPILHFMLEEFDRERTAAAFGKKASLAYQPLVGSVGGALGAYIIVWILSDGTHVITGAMELVTYSIIDISLILGLGFRLSEVKARHASSPHGETISTMSAYEPHGGMYGGYGSTASIQV